MTGAAHIRPLERRYRRLLACYPAAHRAAYAEEMIAVLMSTSTPDQRRPDVFEAVNLVASGVRARLRIPLQAANRPPWRNAVGVFSYLASMGLAALSARHVASSLAVHSPQIARLSLVAVAVPVVWTVVAIATRLGSGRIAATAAATGALGQTIAIARTYVDAPDTVVASWWRLVLAITVAASLIMLIRAPQPTRPMGNHPHLPGVWSTTTIGATAILISVAPLIETRTAIVTGVNADGQSQSYRIPVPPQPQLMFDGRPIGGLVTLIAALALLATLATTVVRLTPPTRRRVLLLTTPVAATAVLVAETFGGFRASSPRFSPPVYLTAPQWIGLVATPILAFAIGAWLHARYENKLASGTLLA